MEHRVTASDSPTPTSDRRPARVLVTAGPTHEPIDAVRYLANRSSGRMGCALAAEAAARGHATTLLLGPGTLPPPESTLLKTERFRTTADLETALGRLWPEHDILLMAAAVADYRPRGGEAGGKLRRGGEILQLELEPTPDLIAGLAGSTRADQTLIAFALEPADGLIDAARAKLARKGAAAIVANPLETMGAESVSASLILADGTCLEAPAELPKAAFARWLMDWVERLCGSER
jgi:phosphopantothenoylcysteine decarboxylase/phosphopantothenate--cysteine ligase